MPRSNLPQYHRQMRPIAVVQHEKSVPPGSIRDVLQESDVDHFVLQAWDDQEWPRAGDLGGLVVLGGTMNADELDRYPFLRSSRDLLSEALTLGLPTMGVCLGSQLMARVLGGDIVRAERRNALFSELEIVGEDTVLAPFASGTPVLQFHEDTFTIPPGTTPLATSGATGLHQAFRYGDRAYAVQFHFEVDDDIVREWCHNIGEPGMSEEWGVSTEDLLAKTRAYIGAQRSAGQELFRRFLGNNTATS